MRPVSYGELKSTALRIIILTESIIFVLLKTMLFLGFLKAAVIIQRKGDTANLIKELGSMWRTDNLNDNQTKKKNRLLKRLNLSHTGSRKLIF